MKSELKKIVESAILERFDTNEMKDALRDAVYIDYEEVADYIMRSGVCDITQIILDNLDTLL